MTLTFSKENLVSIYAFNTNVLIYVTIIYNTISSLYILHRTIFFFTINFNIHKFGDYREYITNASHAATEILITFNVTS